MPFNKDDFQLFRARDEATVRRVYKECFYSSTRRCREDGATLEDQQDIFQDVLLTIFARMDREPGFEIENLCSYLFSACTFLWWKKKGKKLPNGEGLLSNLTGEEIDLDAIEEEELLYLTLQECIKKLEPEKWRLLKLFFYKGKRDKEIAEILGYTVGYIKTKRRRIIQELRKCMGLK